MDGAPDEGPLYTVERVAETPARWRVIGPNGAVGDYDTAEAAEARADFLNEQVAEETEDDA